MKFLRKLLGGAFPEAGHPTIPLEDQHLPEEGIIRAPTTFDINFGALENDPTFVPVCTVLVEPGQMVFAGHTVAEIETSAHVIEIPASADLIIEEILIATGSAIIENQPIARVSGRD